MKQLLGRTLAAGIAAAGLISFAVLPAQAGTSIPKTYNAGTGISYAYYASTDTFCIDPSKNAEGGAIVYFGWASHDPKMTVGGTNMVMPEDGWECWNLKRLGFQEGDRVRFTLNATPDIQNAYQKKISYGYLTV